MANPEDLMQKGVGTESTSWALKVLGGTKPGRKMSMTPQTMEKQDLQEREREQEMGNFAGDGAGRAATTAASHHPGLLSQPLDRLGRRPTV